MEWQWNQIKLHCILLWLLVVMFKIHSDFQESSKSWLDIAL